MTDIFLDIGQKKTIATAVDWPGWCRGGVDQASAQQKLWEYGSRYAAVMVKAGLEFIAPASVSDFNPIEPLPGNGSTDYGVPGLIRDSDQVSPTTDEAKCWNILLLAGWQALDEAANKARSGELSHGPRGGGRDLDRLLLHVYEAEFSYLTSLGITAKPAEISLTAAVCEQNRATILAGIASANHGEAAKIGPRGGRRWPVRYFVRRLAWHLFDHLWELEDRTLLSK